MNAVGQVFIKVHLKPTVIVFNLIALVGVIKAANLSYGYYSMGSGPTLKLASSASKNSFSASK